MRIVSYLIFIVVLTSCTTTSYKFTSSNENFNKIAQNSISAIFENEYMGAYSLSTSEIPYFLNCRVEYLDKLSIKEKLNSLEVLNKINYLMKSLLAKNIENSIQDDYQNTQAENNYQLNNTIDLIINDKSTSIPNEKNPFFEQIRLINEYIKEKIKLKTTTIASLPNGLDIPLCFTEFRLTEANHYTYINDTTNFKRDYRRERIRKHLEESGGKTRPRVVKISMFLNLPYIVNGYRVEAYQMFKYHLLDFYIEEEKFEKLKDWNEFNKKLIHNKDVFGKLAKKFSINYQKFNTKSRKGLIDIDIDKFNKFYLSNYSDYSEHEDLEFLKITFYNYIQNINNGNNDIELLNSLKSDIHKNLFIEYFKDRLDLKWYTYPEKNKPNYPIIFGINLNEYKSINELFNSNNLKIIKDFDNNLYQFSINKLHNEFISYKKERRSFLNALEIGSKWDGGFIEAFNPNRTKAKILISKNDKDSYVWSDLK